MSEYHTITTDEKEAERSLRDRALQLAGHHEKEPPTTKSILERAAAYLEFLKGGDAELS